MPNLKNRVFQLLRSTEPLFKLDMVYLAKGGFWTTLSFVVGTLASIVTMVAFGNLLPRETYGTYNYLISLGATLSFLTLSGMGNAVMRAVARGYENVVPEALRTQLKYNLIAISMVLAGAIYYAYKGNSLFASSLAILALAYPAAEAFHIYKQVLTGKKRFDTLTKLTSVITLISTLVTVAAIFLTQNVIILVTVYASMSFFPTVAAYVITTRNLDKTEPDAEQLKEMKRTAFHLTGAGLIGIIASHIDRIILFQVTGPAALAVYGFALAGPDKLRSLIKNWTSIASPRLAQKSLVDIRSTLYNRIGLSLIFGAIMTLAYLLLAPLLFKLLLPRYLDSIIYSQVLSLSLIVVPVIIYIGSIFTNQNMLRATYILNTGSQIIRIVLFVVFGLLWQIWGLIIASLASHLISAIYSLIILEIEYNRIMKKR